MNLPTWLGIFFLWSEWWFAPDTIWKTCVGERWVYKAMTRVNMQKAGKECGLVLGVLKHAPDSFVDIWVVQFNDVTKIGRAATDLTCWRKFSSANSTLRSGGRVEEHVASTNFVLTKLSNGFASKTRMVWWMHQRWCCLVVHPFLSGTLQCNPTWAGLAATSPRPCRHHNDRCEGWFKHKSVSQAWTPYGAPWKALHFTYVAFLKVGSRQVARHSTNKGNNLSA